MARTGGSRGIAVIRVVWALGFLVGTTTHVIDLVLGGPGVYAGFPDGVRLFWVSLTLLDPLAIVLIALRLRLAVVLAAVIMVADVAVNGVMVATRGLPLPGLVNQVAFGLFVLATAPLVWRQSRTTARRG